MECMPTELLVHIFSFLDSKDLECCEQVSQSWSQIVVGRFWYLEIKRIAEADQLLGDKFLAEGWTPQSDDAYDLNRRLYTKVKSNDWLQKLDCQKTEKRISLCGRQFDAIKKFLIYQRKVFVQHKYGKIESLSLPDFEPLNVVYEGGEVLSHQYMTIPYLMLPDVPLNLQGRTLASTDQDRTKMILFNADTELQVSEFQLPRDDGQPEALKINNVAMNSYMLVCISGKRVFIYRFDPEKPGASDPILCQVLLDVEHEVEIFHRQEYEKMLQKNLLYYDEYEDIVRDEDLSAKVNEDFLVTNFLECFEGCSPLYESFLHIRRIRKRGGIIEIGPIWRVDAEECIIDVEDFRLDGPTLTPSPLNRMAVTQHVSIKPLPYYRNVFDIYDLNAQTKIFSLPNYQDIIQCLPLLTTQLGDCFIMRECYKNHLWEMTAWNSSFKRSQVLRPLVKRNDKSLYLNQDFQIKPFAAVEIYVKLAEDAFDYQATNIYETIGVFYDFWT